MKTYPLVLLVVTAFFLAPSFVSAQVANAEWKALSREAKQFHRDGDYEQAEAVARQALEVAEASVGTNHRDAITSLNNLAILHLSQSQFAQAEPFFQRAVALNEKVLGRDHVDVADSLNKLGALYFAQDQYAQAAPILERALQIREKALGSTHLDLAPNLNNLANFYKVAGQYSKAELLFERALAIFEKELGPEHFNVAAALHNLGGLYRVQARYTLAEPLYHRALEIVEKFYGPDHPELAKSLNNLALLYDSQGQYARAEMLYSRALAINEKSLGADHPSVAVNLYNLAAVYRAQGQHAEAEPLYRRSLVINESTLGPEHSDVAHSLSGLALLYTEQGLYAQAEPLYQRALAIREKTLGPNHPDLAIGLNNLAALYEDQGLHAKATPLLQRALAVNEKGLGPDHPEVARSLNNLAAVFSVQGFHDRALPLHLRSLATREKVLGMDHPDVATSLGNLATVYANLNRNPEVEPLYLRALSIREKSFGSEHPSVAQSLGNLAAHYFNQRQYAKAEPLHRRALASREKAFGVDHPDVAASLNSLVLLYAEQGQYRTAIPLARRSSAIYRKRIIAGGADDSTVLEAAGNQDGFAQHLSLLGRNPNEEAPASITDESFQLVQLEQSTGTSSAVAQMAARFAKGDDAIAALVKRKQDASERRANTEDRLVTAFSQPPENRIAAAETKLRTELARLDRELDAVNAELDRGFPEYQELTRPEPMPVAQVQPLLRQNEAMLVYAIAEDKAWLWVVRPDKAEFMPIEASHQNLAEQVRTIRQEMEFTSSGELQKVDVALLHQLHQTLFAPALPHLDGIEHLMIVPDGPLQSLPFSMLVASAPQAIRSDADYRKVDWLMQHYALSVLPSVSSIRALRQFAKPGTGQQPFIGFGDPLLKESPGTQRSLRQARVDLNGLFRGLAVVPHLAKQAGVGPRPITMSNAAAPAPRIDLQPGVADVAMIRAQPRLPESADELRAMAGIVDAGKPADSLWLQARATEANVKTQDLSKYRMLAFATHGVMADEMAQGMEAGLLLTPPAKGTLEDDGYLSTSEIAQLKLNADWVLLSACNTAAADGTPGAEGLSGLAKAFFYAGTRSLLVSHWPVASEATVPLTTVMLREYESNPAQGKAEAQRKAMQALMATDGHPEYAHPLFWAPFVVVGEGAGSPGTETAQ